MTIEKTMAETSTARGRTAREAVTGTTSAATGAERSPASQAPSGATPRPGLGRRLVHLLVEGWHRLAREAAKFGTVGLVAFVVDFYVYNLLRSGWWPLTEGPMAHKPVMSKAISVAVATVVAWLGNRYWTFRHRRRATFQAEFVLFVVMNIGGLAIAAGCIWFSHYVLDLTSKLADNISGNVVGLVLGTLFRFWAYRQFVFTEKATEQPA